ncbi:MAG: tetratricopeptide repeat protein [Muribaculaceae bacterium]|nr:tetratricopeptide repeat protein [Muribaculaceae bacterium]
MKNLSIFLACALFVSGSAVAQKNLVDAVNKDISGYTPDYKAARAKLKPAFNDVETKDDARTYFVAGKTEFGYYDQLLGKKQLRQEVNDLEMSNALLDGYNLFKKAFPLDSVQEVDKKGKVKLDKEGRPKVKTKYSKDMANLIVGHFNDFNIIGSTYYEAKEYKKAYEVWGIFASLPGASCLGKNAPVLPDTIIGQVQFFQGIAAWQAGDNKAAIESFASARKKGYVKKEAFDYAISCCAALKDNAGIIALAKEAYQIFGSKDNQYISLMINDYINNSKYKEATELLDEAIAANPTNAEFYNVKGSLYENQKDMEKAFEYFMKALELNPEYAKGQFDVGRYYFNKAVQKREAINKLSGAAYQKAIVSELNPLYEKALPYLEKAYQLDPENSDVKHALKNIYYFLGNEAKLNALEKGY